MTERCDKPGCGALRIVGRPCTDWDCPQQTVSAAEYRAAIDSVIERCATIAETLGPWRMADNVGYVDVPATGEQIAEAIRRIKV